jgi:hypothetical protein
VSEQAVLDQLKLINDTVIEIRTYQNTHFETLKDHEIRIRNNEQKTLKHSIYSGLASFVSGSFIIGIIAYFTRGGSA